MMCVVANCLAHGFGDSGWNINLIEGGGRENMMASKNGFGKGQ